MTFNIIMREKKTRKQIENNCNRLEEQISKEYSVSFIVEFHRKNRT